MSIFIPLHIPPAPPIEPHNRTKSECNDNDYPKSSLLHLTRFHRKVDRHRNRICFSRNITRQHQRSTKLTESPCKRQHQSRKKSRPSKRKGNRPKTPSTLKPPSSEPHFPFGHPNFQMPHLHFDTSTEKKRQSKQ